MQQQAAEDSITAADKREAEAAAAREAAAAVAEAARAEEKAKRSQEIWTSADSEAYKQVLGDPFLIGTTHAQKMQEAREAYLERTPEEKMKAREAYLKRVETAHKRRGHLLPLKPLTYAERRERREREELAESQTYDLMLEHAYNTNLPNLTWDKAKSMVEADLARQDDLKSRLKSRIDEKTEMLIP